MFLGYHEEKNGGRLRIEVSFFFILVPNLIGNLLILNSICPAGFVLFLEYCIEMKLRGILACIDLFTSKEMK